MIVFTNLKASNAFSYTELDFDFVNGLHSISGMNGSSKTSLFLTLQQGLFNRNAKGCKVEEVNNSITKKPYHIEVSFLVGDVPYKVINSRKDDCIKLYRGEDDISLVRKPDVLKQIQELLNCNFETFVDLTYQSKSSTLNILDSSTNKGRAEFVNRNLKLNELDAHLERMNSARKGLEGKGGTIQLLQESINLLEASLMEELTEPELVSEPTMEVAELRERESKLKVTLAEKKAELAALHDKQADYEDYLVAVSRIEKLKNEYSAMEDGSDPAVTDWEIEELQEQLAKRREAAAVVTKEIADATAKLAAKEEVDRLNRELGKLSKPDASLDELRTELADHLKVTSTQSEQLKQTKLEYDRLVSASEAGTCYACGHEVDKDKFAAEIEQQKVAGMALKADQAIRKDRIAALQTLITAHEVYAAIENKLLKAQAKCGDVCDIEAKEAELQTHHEMIGFNQTRINLLKEQTSKFSAKAEKARTIKTLESSLKEVDAVDEATVAEMASDIAHVASKLVETTRALEETTDILISAQRNNERCRTVRVINKKAQEHNASVKLSIDQKTKDLNEAEAKLDLLKIWVNILGSKGYRTSKIDKFLKTLNVTMVKYSKLMCEGKIVCKFFLDDKGEINFTITDEAKTQDITLWSGGETARIKVVCLFAVLELLEAMGSTSFNVLCLDEIFSALDDEGKEGLFKVLTYLKGKNKAIYTIAHEALTLDVMYDSHIQALKLSNGTTKIIGG